LLDIRAYRSELDAREPPVEVELLGWLRNIAVGQVRPAFDGDLGRRVPVGLGLAAESTDRLFQEPGVRIQPDGVDEPGLFRTQDVTRAPQLQVLQRDGVAAAELGVVLE